MSGSLLESPQGWIEVALPEIADINPSNPSQVPADDEEVSFLPMSEAEAITGKMHPSDRRYWGKVKKGYTRFQEGDVLFAKITPCMENGKTVLARGLHGGVGAGSTEFHVLRSSDAVYNAFLLHYLLQEAFRRHVRANMTGTAGQLRVPKRFLEEHRFFLPPIPEQHRIVEAIESYLTRLDDAVATLVRVQQTLKRYRASVLNAAVEGRLTHSENDMQPVPLVELIEGLGQGWSPRCDLTRPPLPHEWGVIKTTAVQSMRYEEQECKPLPPELEPRPNIEIKAGDILMTRKGPRKRAGVSCLVKSTRPHLMICDTVYRFRCRTSAVRPSYLELALNSPTIVSEIDAKKSGISDSGVSLTHKKIGAVMIPLPALDVQQSIVDEVSRLLSVADACDTEVDHDMKRIDRLRQSILKWAFEGKLVDQNQSDEPASVLLERIKAERETMKPTKKATRRGGRRKKVR